MLKGPTELRVPTEKGEGKESTRLYSLRTATSGQVLNLSVPPSIRKVKMMLRISERCKEATSASTTSSSDSRCRVIPFTFCMSWTSCTARPYIIHLNHHFDTLVRGTETLNRRVKKCRTNGLPTKLNCRRYLGSPEVPSLVGNMKSKFYLSQPVGPSGHRGFWHGADVTDTQSTHRIPIHVPKAISK